MTGMIFGDHYKHNLQQKTGFDHILAVQLFRYAVSWMADEVETERGRLQRDGYEMNMAPWIFEFYLRRLCIPHSCFLFLVYIETLLNLNTNVYGLLSTSLSIEFVTSLLPTTKRRRKGMCLDNNMQTLNLDTNKQILGF